MAEVLVLVDQLDGEVKRATHELLTVAKALGEPAAVVVGPAGTAGKITDGLKAHGAAKIYVAETDSTAFLTPEVDTLESLIGSVSPAAVLISASADGKEVAGRLAVRTGSALLGDVVGVSGSGVTHSVFGGAFTAEAQWKGEHPVITVRPGSVEVEESAGAGTEESVSVPASGAKSATV